MKNILFISHEASRTGAPLVLLALLKELKQRYPEQKVKVLQVATDPVKAALEPDFRLVSDLYTLEWDKKDGIKRFLPGRIRFRMNRRELEQWLTEQPFDLIYANTIASVPKAVELKHRFHIPVLLHIHESEYTCRQYGVKQEELLQCDRFIAVSSTVVDALHLYGVTDDKITVIRPFSENLDKVKTADPNFRIPGVEKDDFVIGLSGAGGWRKGFDLLPQLAKIFTDKYPQVKCKFVWVGWGDQNALDYESRRLGVQDCIVFTGNIPNPMDYYNQFDLFLLTSREDPFPLVCMECAALAKPIILFENASGIADMVKHEQTGLLVPYLDLSAMADAIYRLYSDKEFARELGLNLQTSLQRDYGKEKSLNSIIELLQ